MRRAPADAGARLFPVNHGPAFLSGEWACRDGQLLVPGDFSGAGSRVPRLTGYVGLTAAGIGGNSPKTYPFQGRPHLPAFHKDRPVPADLRADGRQDQYEQPREFPPQRAMGRSKGCGDIAIAFNCRAAGRRSFFKRRILIIPSQGLNIRSASGRRTRSALPLQSHMRLNCASPFLPPWHVGLTRLTGLAASAAAILTPYASYVYLTGALDVLLVLLQMIRIAKRRGSLCGAKSI